MKHLFALTFITTFYKIDQNILTRFKFMLICHNFLYYILLCHTLLIAFNSFCCVDKQKTITIIKGIFFKETIALHVRKQKRFFPSVYNIFVMENIFFIGALVPEDAKEYSINS